MSRFESEIVTDPLTDNRSLKVTMTRDGVTVCALFPIAQYDRLDVVGHKLNELHAQAVKERTA